MKRLDFTPSAAIAPRASELEGLLIDLRSGRAQVLVLAGDLTAQRRLEPLARWVERMLRGLRMWP